MRNLKIIHGLMLTIWLKWPHVINFVVLPILCALKFYIKKEVSMLTQIVYVLNHLKIGCFRAKHLLVGKTKSQYQGLLQILILLPNLIMNLSAK
ncbi:hypothetical protein APT61_08120 [Leclercia adecarboxylata]|nr:hypothetical protein APT61_08120 [Leclercia adecarboxylata]